MMDSYLPPPPIVRLAANQPPRRQKTSPPAQLATPAVQETATKAVRFAESKPSIPFVIKKFAAPKGNIKPNASRATTPKPAIKKPVPRRVQSEIPKPQQPALALKPKMRSQPHKAEPSLNIHTVSQKNNVPATNMQNGAVDMRGPIHRPQDLSRIPVLVPTPFKKPIINLLDDDIEFFDDAPVQSSSIPSSPDDLIDLIDLDELPYNSAKSHTPSPLSSNTASTSVSEVLSPNHSKAAVIEEFNFLVNDTQPEAAGKAEIKPIVKPTEVSKPRAVAGPVHVVPKHADRSPVKAIPAEPASAKHIQAVPMIKKTRGLEPRTPEFSDSEEEWLNPMAQNVPVSGTSVGGKKKFVFSCSPNSNEFVGIRVKSSAQATEKITTKPIKPILNGGWQVRSVSPEIKEEPKAYDGRGWPPFPGEDYVSEEEDDEKPSPEVATGEDEEDIWLPEEDDSEQLYLPITAPLAPPKVIDEPATIENSRSTGFRLGPRPTQPENARKTTVTSMIDRKLNAAAAASTARFQAPRADIRDAPNMSKSPSPLSSADEEPKRPKSSSSAGSLQAKVIHTTRNTPPTETKQEKLRSAVNPSPSLTSPPLRRFHMGPRPKSTDRPRDRKKALLRCAYDYVNLEEEYPFESIREVRLEDLPYRAHLWHILERVRGGALECAQYSINKRCIDLIFLEHKDARAFWEYVDANGFYVPVPNHNGVMTERKKVQLMPFTRIPDVRYLTAGNLERVRESHCSRVLILINVPANFNGEKVYGDVRDEVTKQMDRKITPGEFIEGAMIVREDTVSYWPMIPKGANTDDDNEFTRRDWNYREHGKAVIVRLSSIELALAAYQALSALPDYRGVRFGWVQDHCARSLDMLKVAGKEESPVDEHIELLNPENYLSEGKRDRMIEVHRNEVAVFISNIPPGTTIATLTRYIRGGALESVSIARGGTGGKNKYDEAFVHFCAGSGADAYAKYANENPITIGKHVLQVTRGFSHRILDVFPKENMWLNPTPCTRVVIFTKMSGICREDENGIQTIIDNAVRRRLDYEAAYFVEDFNDQCMVRFGCIDHARIAYRAMKESFLQFGASYMEDPCAGSFKTIGILQ